MDFYTNTQIVGSAEGHLALGYPVSFVISREVQMQTLNELRF